MGEAVKLNAEELNAFLVEVFPQVEEDYVVLKVTADSVRVRLKTGARHLRPGGTVSGPSMFGLADVAFYAMVLARIGREALTVTTNCSIDFMRKPPPEPLIGEARLLKLGRVLAVGDVLITAEAGGPPLARANLTYSIPPVPGG
ncbi:MAG: PaaI family thioesterase [Pseudomonadota bacterium]